MKIFSPNKKTKIAVVCCIHGDERFGLTVFKHLTKKKYGEVKLVLAHEQAVKKGVRYIESDLNRSFPGQMSGGLESRLARQILKEVNNIPYLIDIHTTTSAIRMTPIITKLNQHTQQILNTCSSREIAYMRGSLGKASLIYQVQGGVSLEYNEYYAKTKLAMQEIDCIITNILKKFTLPRKKRKIYEFTSTIPRTIVLPRKAKNFAKLKAIDAYSFLLREKSYITHQGFMAKKIKYQKI